MFTSVTREQYLFLNKIYSIWTLAFLVEVCCSMNFQLPVLTSSDKDLYQSSANVKHPLSANTFSAPETKTYNVNALL